MPVNPLVFLLDTLLSLYSTALIIWVVLTWLIQFNIINAYQPLVQKVNYALYRLNEPVLKRIRRIMPDMGGIDLSPIILIVGVYFLRYCLMYYFG